MGEGLVLAGTLIALTMMPMASATHGATYFKNLGEKSVNDCLKGECRPGELLSALAALQVIPETSADATAEDNAEDTDGDKVIEEGSWSADGDHEGAIPGHGELDSTDFLDRCSFGNTNPSDGLVVDACYTSGHASVEGLLCGSKRLATATTSHLGVEFDQDSASTSLCQ